jgi:hypothetical protein
MPRGHFPFVGGLAQDQEEQFDRSFVVWEVAAGAHGATKLGAACCGMRALAIDARQFRIERRDPVDAALRVANTSGWSMSGPIYEDEIANRHRASVIHLALRDIADAQGDVDAFIAQYDGQTQKVPRIAAEIARRLLTAGPSRRSLANDRSRRAQAVRLAGFRREDARIDVLEALERPDDAQVARWSRFERFLSARHLRDYLK